MVFQYTLSAFLSHSLYVDIKLPRWNCFIEGSITSSVLLLYHIFYYCQPAVLPECFMLLSSSCIFQPFFYWLLDDTVLCYYHFYVSFNVRKERLKEFFVLRYYHLYVSFNSAFQLCQRTIVLRYYHFYVSFNSANK